MKKTLLFLKDNWRSLVLLGWMIWITNVVLDTKDAAQSTSYQSYVVDNIESTVDNIESEMSSIESTVVNIESEVSSIKSDVSTIEDEVTSEYGYTLRATVEEIKNR